MLVSASKDADFSILFFCKTKAYGTRMLYNKMSSPKERMRTHMLTANYIESLMNIKAECIKNTYETVA